MTLYLLRHPPTLAAEGLCYGRTDVAVAPELLAPTARAAVAALGPAWQTLQEVVVSPLQRCSGLAQAMAALGAGKLLRTDPRIAEMDFGAWEGRPWSAIARDEFEAWTGDFADARAGGCGESTRAFMQRVGEAFDAWCDSGHDALWVTHAGVIRAVWLLREGVRCPMHATQWPAAPVGYGEVVRVAG